MFLENAKYYTLSISVKNDQEGNRKYQEQMKGRREGRDKTKGK